jgi:hypothetical protein
MNSFPPHIMPFTFGEGSQFSGYRWPFSAKSWKVLSAPIPLDVFHGQELSSQMCVSIMRAGQRVSLLSIDAIAAGHSGDYTSRASNKASSVDYTATLAVNGSSHVTFRTSLAPLSIF